MHQQTKGDLIYEGPHDPLSERRCSDKRILLGAQVCVHKGVYVFVSPSEQLLFCADVALVRLLIPITFVFGVVTKS